MRARRLYVYNVCLFFACLFWLYHILSRQISDDDFPMLHSSNFVCISSKLNFLVVHINIRSSLFFFCGIICFYNDFMRSLLSVRTAHFQCETTKALSTPIWLANRIVQCLCRVFVFMSMGKKGITNFSLCDWIGLFFVLLFISIVAATKILSTLFSHIFYIC